MHSAEMQMYLANKQISCFTFGVLMTLVEWEERHLLWRY